MLPQTQLEPRASLSTKNQVLAALSAADAALLTPHLQLVDLPREQRLKRRGRSTDYVYFLERGMACALGDEPGGHGVEIGIIGREGFVGVSAVLGAGQSPHDVQMIASGAARRAPIGAVREAMDESPSFRRAMLSYVQRFLVQAMREAQINARATLEARLARWLLMMHDRVDGDELHVTHDRLAAMLGVRRAGVSVAAKKLERAGVILLHRGSILIQDRKQLEVSTGGAYGAVDRPPLERTIS
jgi:CRP-like cAMP-binding protein